MTKFVIPPAGVTIRSNMNQQTLEDGTIRMTFTEEGLQWVVDLHHDLIVKNVQGPKHYVPTPSETARVIAMAQIRASMRAPDGDMSAEARV